MDTIVTDHLATWNATGDEAVSGPAPGYVIGYLENVDVGPEIIEYIERIEGTFEPYGGQWLVHNMPHVNHEGNLRGNVIIIGFPTINAAREWFASEAYQQIAPLRTEHAESIVLSVEGVPQGYRGADTTAKMRSVASTS